MRDTLKILALLLDYPRAEIQARAQELGELLKTEAALPDAGLEALSGLLDQLACAELLELQEDYVACFDRGRSLSLHLFEHVHGESRDRGQAMVDLRDAYQQAGLELDARQLPDYLPVFMEFCAHLPAAEARRWMVEVAHILRLLYARMQARQSVHAAVLGALLMLAGEPLEEPEILAKVRAEQPDDTPESLDAAWEEKPVSFSCATAACGAVAGAGADPSSSTVPLVRYAAPSESEGSA